MRLTLFLRRVVYGRRAPHPTDRLFNDLEEIRDSIKEFECRSCDYEKTLKCPDFGFECISAPERGVTTTLSVIAESGEEHIISSSEETVMIPSDPWPGTSVPMFNMAWHNKHQLELIELIQNERLLSGLQPIREVKTECATGLRTAPR